MSGVYKEVKTAGCLVSLLTLVSMGGGIRSLAVAASMDALPRLCVIYFDKDARLPARVEDQALPCLLRAEKAFAASNSVDLYLVGTADKVKDNMANHGRTRVREDRTGEDLRYADVAAYRAINTKAYLTRWLAVDPTRVVPLTSYQDGQSVELYLVKKGVVFKQAYGRATAPILSRPCTVKPCATGPEEFLVAQPRDQISAH